MKILVINTGSSSLKYRIFDMGESKTLAGGVMERIGESSGVWTHFVSASEDKKKETLKLEIKDHKQGLKLAVKKITDPETGVVSDISEIDAIGHRVVQGGEIFTVAARIDEAVKKEAAELDGCYVIKTDLSVKVATAETIHDRYKDLARVERAFRIFKSGHLEVRPTFVRTEASTRGHVFVVMLAYLLERELDKYWCDL